MSRRKTVVEILVDEFETIVRKRAIATGREGVIAAILYEQARENLLAKIRSLETTISRLSGD